MKLTFQSVAKKCNCVKNCQKFRVYILLFAKRLSIFGLVYRLDFGLVSYFSSKM